MGAHFRLCNWQCHSNIFFCFYFNMGSMWYIDIERLQDRLLKVCYVMLQALVLQGFFFAVAINSTNEANKAGSTCH